MKLANVVDGSADNKVTLADREIIGDANPVHTGLHQCQSLRFRPERKL